MEPEFLTATQALALLRSGRLTSERLVSACLERIMEKEPGLGAWVEINAAQALEQAWTCDRQPSGRPLHGIPVGVKDVLDTRDFSTRCQSPIYAYAQPFVDAYSVAAVRRAGAIVLGKTTTSEFAYVTPPTTRNPHHPGYSPGGSSSGSAAAVAAHMVPLSISTQTGGSTIRPAAYCGIVGFKPSFGLINRAGLKSLAESLDTIGAMGRSVDDVALLAGVMAYRSLPCAPLQRRYRIAVCADFLQPWAQQDALEHMAEAAHRLENAGAELIPIALPEIFERLVQDQTLIMEYEAARALLAEQQEHSDLLSVGLRERLERGWRHKWSEYRQAQARAAACRRQWKFLLAGTDAFLTYSACGQAPRASPEHAGDSVMNRAWTLLGVPCIALPAGFGDQGLPLGIQLVGEAGRDESLLGVARWVAGKIV